MPRSNASGSGAATLRSGATVLAGSMVVNVLNYAFTLAMGRILPVAAFGEIAALFALQLVTGVPGATLTAIAAKFSGQFSGRGQLHHVARLMAAGRRMGGRIALATAAILLVATPLLSSVLHIRPVPIVLFALLSGLGPLLALEQGTLQGLQRFGAAAVANVLPTVAKLALGILLVWIGWGVEGVMVALLAGAAIGWGYAYASTRDLVGRDLAPAPSADDEFPRDALWSHGRVILTVTLLSALFTNADILLAKAFLPPELAGQYSALTVVGKVVLYGAGAFAAVVLPLVASAADHAGRRRDMLMASLAAAGFLAVGVAMGFTLFPDLAVQLLLGDAYAGIGTHLSGYVWAMAMGVIGALLTNYLIARERRSALYPLSAGLAVELVSLALRHATIGDYVLANLLCNATFLVLAAFFTYCDRE